MLRLTGLLRYIWLLILAAFDAYELAAIDRLAQKLAHQRRVELQCSLSVLKHGIGQAEQLEDKLARGLSGLSTTAAQKVIIETFERGIQQLREQLLAHLSGESVPSDIG